MAENMTLEAAAYTGLGTPREKVSLPATLFDGTVNHPVMHQAVKAFLANQRQGTHATKTRRWVTGGNQKPWKQKGTGRARQGSTRAPNWPGGGTVFGPQPRSYTQDLPKKVRQLAKKSAFNARAAEQAVLVIDQFQYEAPKTAKLQQLLARLGVSGKKALVLTDGVKPNVWKSGRNLPQVQVLPYAEASTYHLLWSDVVLVESSALGQALSPIAEKEPAPVKVKKAAAPAKAAKAPKAEKAPAKKKTTKAAASAPAKKAPAAKKAAAKKAPAAKAAPKKKGK